MLPQRLDGYLCVASGYGALCVVQGVGLGVEMGARLGMPPCC